MGSVWRRKGRGKTSSRPLGLPSFQTHRILGCSRSHALPLAPSLESNPSTGLSLATENTEKPTPHSPCESGIILICLFWCTEWTMVACQMSITSATGCCSKFIGTLISRFEIRDSCDSFGEWNSLFASFSFLFLFFFSFRACSLFLAVQLVAIRLLIACPDKLWSL